MSILVKLVQACMTGAGRVDTFAASLKLLTRRALMIGASSYTADGGSGQMMLLLETAMCSAQARLSMTAAACMSC